MSNFRAIATVTAALRDLFQETAGHDLSDVAGVTVTAERPDNPTNGTSDTRINIYLYQVTPNPSWRNADLPTRRSNGSVSNRPLAALDLYYMISFYGNEDELVPQLLLGSVVRTLHIQPFLTRERIRATISNGNSSLLASSNLADQVELVKFSPLHLSLEEFSRIWSVFFQIPYALSVAYQGSVILIEGDEMPQRPLPVLKRNIYAIPFHQPLIDQVTVQQAANHLPGEKAWGAFQPIVANSMISLIGQRLLGDNTLVRISDGEPFAPQSVSNKRIIVDLSKVPGLQAGVQGVQVIQQLVIGSPAIPHPGGSESNVVPFVLSPSIQKKPDGDYDISLTNVQGTGSAPRSVDITFKITPAIGRWQRVVLLLNEISPVPRQPLDHPPHAYSFDAPARTEDSTDAITFSMTGISAGTYLVRISVDGAESPLDVDTKYWQGATDPASQNLENPTFNTLTGTPQVTIP